MKDHVGKDHDARARRTIPSLPPEARDRWRIYPIWPVNARGFCLCSEGQACGSPGKHPACRHGVNDAVSDPVEVAQMFASRPGYNLGLATGVTSGVAVLDWDEFEGGGSSRRLLQEIHGPIPVTRMHQTGSGALHELFAVPVGTERLPSRTLAPGLELKADGAGVVLPPSRTDRGTYEVLIEGPLATLPSWVEDLAAGLSVIEGGGDGFTRSRYELPEKIDEGTRAWTLYRYGCSLRARGSAHDAILGELLRVDAERCVPPLSETEVRKIARSAARHEAGNAATVTPEALDALADIEAAVMGSLWPEPGGGSEYSVMVALVLAARRHGSLIPAGVRVSLDFRSLGLAASMGKSTANRAAHRLRRKGWLRFDNRDRPAEHSGAFVLLASTPRTTGHPTTPSEHLRIAEPVSVPFGAPRLRRGGSFGKGCEKALDALEGAGGEMALQELAAAAGTKRARDLRRRVLNRLEEAKVVRVDLSGGEGGTVKLRGDWLAALERERMASGEKRAENLLRAEYERQREARRVWMAERADRSEEGR